MRWLRLLGVLGSILVLYLVAPVSADPPERVVVRAVIGVAALLGLTAGLVEQLRRAVRDDERRVEGLVAAIVTVLVVFAYAFYALEVHRPEQLDGLVTRLDALYFSASTMLTVGYGDVHATGQAARALVLLQMVFDVVFVASAAGLLTARVRRGAARRTVSRDG
ncbi:potassium channel family protein [Nocardioides lianchengensis]|uniref:Ion channel n=1 Tax=Nocardioides lianchengensis TaxID=1045774 RepID=A0A1G6W590_9ACTN|nr:potassium channel family protein [Nocardioides lianchengensis]NYG09451.1 putative membrane protein [Nocardioides lianchengensis]SDD60387.1 Ion channel [Nocardioides lianchengensis]